MELSVGKRRVVKFIFFQIPYCTGDSLMYSKRPWLSRAEVKIIHLVLKNMKF